MFQPDQIAYFPVCPAGPPDNPDANYGYGETIQTMEPPVMSGFASAWQVLTHNELEDPGTGPCTIHVDCETTGFHNHTVKHLLNNDGCEFFSLRRSNARTAYVVAVAAGYPATGALPNQHVPCAWTAYYGEPMLALFDVTQTGTANFSKPILLQIALGSGQGHAFAVRTKTYTDEGGTKIYAFVGDLLGRLIIFDVSENKLFPAASGPPYLNGMNHPLDPLCTVSFPRDPYDGLRPNVISLAINGDYLYCALARGGIGIVDISQQPTSSSPPPLVSVLDTPGLDLGVAFRTFTVGQQSVTQMIVGDSRCGIRVYQ